MEEGNLLRALQRYYLEDISFERAAEEAGVTIHELVEYVKKHALPVIHTEKDVVDGLRKVNNLMQIHGVKGVLVEG